MNAGQPRKQPARLEQRPLQGHRVLITRQLAQSGPLRQQLQAAGARVDEFPLIELAGPPDTAPLDAAVQRLDSFTWVIFTSPNAVTFFHDRLEAAGLDSRALERSQVAVVGAATEAALRSRGIRADLAPEVQTREGLIAACNNLELMEAKLLIPGSELAPDHLDAALTAHGARITRVIAYINRPPHPDPLSVDALVSADPPVDTVLFASPSAVRHLPLCVGARNAQALLERTTIACIGPTTSAAVRDAGYAVHIQPATSSVSALTAALCAHYQAHP